MKLREIRKITQLLKAIPEGDKSVIIINTYNFPTASTQWNTYNKEDRAKPINP